MAAPSEHRADPERSRRLLPLSYAWLSRIVAGVIDEFKEPLQISVTSWLTKRLQTSSNSTASNQHQNEAEKQPGKSFSSDTGARSSHRTFSQSRYGHRLD